MNQTLVKKKIIVICGPTGVGKTSFAIELAQKFNGEIIGADSMQIYKFMDIGTAKPEPLEQKLARHHLIDFLLPHKEFDAGKYIEMADNAINDIYSRSKLSIVVGGTGLYIKALIYGLFRDREIDRGVVNRLEGEIDTMGTFALHSRLATLDPEAAKRIHPNDGFRIVRALEVVEVTGEPISSFQSQHSFCSQRYTPLKIALHIDREKLYQRIEKRVDIMIEQGFVDEVKSLIGNGYGCELKSMQSIGYRHVCDFLNCKTSWEETIRLLKRDTRRYAKRQLTWFRQDKDITWLAPDEMGKAKELIEQFLN
ncbi:MAG: tRNA (adenosine(37)-N6)-dimethylallyltransferase MiaA [Desulfamplus sp.]|nr:tRNA (adenosine(37)-N6)-dimethylallyltransferase MiaA [Desulfamplus sp.]